MAEYMKFLKDTPLNKASSVLLSTQFNQSEGSRVAQPKQGFAESLSHQISKAEARSKPATNTDIKTSAQPDGSAADKNSEPNNRGRRLPSREQNLPHNPAGRQDSVSSVESQTEQAQQSAPTRASSRASERDVTTDESIPASQQNSPSDINDPATQSSSPTNSDKSAVATPDTQWLDLLSSTTPDSNAETTAAQAFSPVIAAEPQTQDVAPTGDLALFNPTPINPSEATGQMGSDEANNNAEPGASIDLPGGLWTTMPGTGDQQTVLSKLSDNALNTAATVPPGSAGQALATGGLLSGLIKPALSASRTSFSVSAPDSLTASLTVLQPMELQKVSVSSAQSGQYPLTGQISSLLQDGQLWQQTSLPGAAPGSVPVDGEIAAQMESGSDGITDLEMIFSGRLADARTSATGSLQYAASLSQAASQAASAPAGMTETPLTSDTMLQRLPVQVSTQSGPDLASVLAAGEAQAPGSSGSQLLSATLYSQEQRQQAAIDARHAQLQNTRVVDTSLATTSALKLPGLDVAFGQAGWVDRIGRQLLLQSAQGSSSAQIRLDPPELGSLTVKIQLVDQSAAVNFVSPHAMVRDALEQQSGRLQDMFREQGMELLDVSVSDQSAQSDGGEQNRQSGSRSGTTEWLADDISEARVITRQSDRLIDYYA